MRNRLQRFVAVVLLFLGGCAVSPIPPGYTGPTAKIIDSSEMETNFRAVYFFVSEVNGNRIQTNLDANREANRGMGFRMTGGTISRLAPAGTATLKLEGRHAYGAPIQEIVMAATMRSVTEIIEANLKPDESYQVRGILAEGRDDVWLEVLGTGERIGKKVC